MYNLRKDIKQFTRRVRLWGYLYLDEEVDGDFSNVYTPLDENTTEAMVQEIMKGFRSLSTKAILRSERETTV